MQRQSFLCDRCKSLNSSGVLLEEAYRLNLANFNRYRLETMGNNPTGPMNHRNEEFIICNFCKEAFEADLNALFGVLRANQTEMRGEI